jgi:hypothetical protein
MCPAINHFGGAIGRICIRKLESETELETRRSTYPFYPLTLEVLPWCQFDVSDV